MSFEKKSEQDHFIMSIAKIINNPDASEHNQKCKMLSEPERMESLFSTYLYIVTRSWLGSTEALFHQCDPAGFSRPSCYVRH